MRASRFLHSVLARTCYEYQSPHVNLEALLTPSTILGSRLFQIPSLYLQLPGSLFFPLFSLLPERYSPDYEFLLSASLKGSHGCFGTPPDISGYSLSHIYNTFLSNTPAERLVWQFHSALASSTVPHFEAVQE